MFLVISPTGVLTTIDAPADMAAIRGMVGDFDLVRLHAEPRMYAFVNDDGFALNLDRNPVGACLIASLGARPGMYVGPIAVTGWEHPSEDTEIRDLSAVQADYVREVHGHVLRALSGERISFVGAENWSHVMRRYADEVRLGPLPTIAVMPFAEFHRPQAADR
jgi:hypothetical protein